MPAPLVMFGGKMIQSTGRTVAGGVKQLSAAPTVKSSPVLRMSSSGVSSSGAISPRASNYPPSPESPLVLPLSCSLLDGEDWVPVEEVAGTAEPVGEVAGTAEPVGEVAGTAEPVGDVASALWDDEEAGADEGFYFAYDSVFGRGPSKEEAEDAMATLQRILGPVVCPEVWEDGYSAFKEETDLIKEDGSNAIKEETDLIKETNIDFPSELSEGWQSNLAESVMQHYSSNSDLMQHYSSNSDLMQHYSSNSDQEKVLASLELFKTDPRLQRVVVSISSDQSVWDAVMNNPAVQELRESLCDGAPASNIVEVNSDHKKDIGLLRWIENAKGKIGEFLQLITKLAIEIFHRKEIANQEKNDQENSNNAFENSVRSSIVISAMLFTVIILRRLQESHLAITRRHDR